MKPGQVIAGWFQSLQAGRLRTPQAIYRAALADASAGDVRASDRFLDLPPDDPNIWAAPARLRAPGFFFRSAFLDQMHRADWQHTDPRLMRWAAVFVEMARRRGIPLYVHCAFRTKAEQAELVRSGRSRTPYPSSAHNIGEAVDIVHGVLHWDMTPQEWSLLGVLGRLALDRVNSTLKAADKLSLDWGGDWSFYDPAHWQISTYRARVKRLPVLPPVRMTPRFILSKYKA